MIYEVHLKIRKKNEERELSYFEAWRIEGPKSFMPYEKPILNTVFMQEWPLPIPPPEPSDVYMVLVETNTSSTKERNRAFIAGRNLIRNYLEQQETPTFLVYEEERI
jgi:hypothetical protein